MRDSQFVPTANGALNLLPDGNRKEASGGTDKVGSGSNRSNTDNQSRLRGDPLSGAAYSLGKTLSFGMGGSLMFGDQEWADVEAFDSSYGAAAAVLGMLKNLRNPAAAAKNVVERVERVAEKEAIWSSTKNYLQLRMLSGTGTSTKLSFQSCQTPSDMLRQLTR